MGAHELAWISKHAGGLSWAQLNIGCASRLGSARVLLGWRLAELVQTHMSATRKACGRANLFSIKAYG